jgi:ketosteroid isomerase-like protein
MLVATQPDDNRQELILMAKSAQDEIQAMVDRETAAWDSQDAQALVSLFHPDMVWPWPNNPNDHDPINWICPMGRFNANRWRDSWQCLFDSHILIHNRRRIVKIVVTEQADGGFAIVDVDTLWRHRQSGEDFHWYGRACKVYTQIGREWKIISHTGLLNYKV